MSQDNQITLRGYVTAEPKFWQKTPTQPPVAEIRVGSTPRRLNRDTGEWLDGDTSYYTVKCWRRLAVNVASCLRKGDMVIIRGKVVMRTWLDDQQRSRSQMQVEADSVGHDLSFGWSHFNRGVQVPRNAAQQLADGEMARQDGSYDPEAGGGGPGAGEPGAGGYDDYLPASLPRGDGQVDQDDQDDRDDRDDRDEPAGAADVIAEMVRDLGAPTEVAPVF
jgi:single-strand DNA-binding protein